MPPSTDNEEIKRLLARNEVLLQENSKLLQKINRHLLYGFWFRIIWYVILIGLPFALYFYVLEPYFTALGSSYDTFSNGLKELPGWKQFIEAIEHIRQARGQ